MAWLPRSTPRLRSVLWLARRLAEVMGDPLGAIWIRPEEYRAVTAGTPFDAERNLSGGVYRRQPEREAFVEAKIKKLRLLE